MKRVLCGLAAGCALALAAPAARAQTFPSPGWFREVVQRPAAPVQIPGPEGLRDYLQAGKLRLTLADAIRLTLANNTDVRVNQLTYELALFPIRRAYQPFDPVLISSFNTTRSNSPTSSQLQGAQTLSSLAQQSQFSYAQAFQTGTSYGIGFSANKSSTNSRFATFNPSIFTSLNFTVSQPLLRNRGVFPNRAPIAIARRNYKQSGANFEAQVSDAVSRAVNQYWDVVQARENLVVLRKSYEQAEATYQQNKRALELGALPPLDIYRSESQVATRRLQVIQAEYALKQAEDELRRTIGADLDLQIRALDLELLEPTEPAGELRTIDAEQAITQALQRRPELEALRQQLANDDTSIRLAHNSLQPDLSLTGFFSSSGQGGHQFDLSMTPPTLASLGGLHEALDQLGSFDFPTYGFSVQLRLPIKNHSAEADLGTSEVSKRRDLYSLRQREQAISLEARNAVHQLEQAKLSMAAAKIARDLSLKNLEAEQRKYELGAQTIFFVLDAQSQLAQAELSLVQSQINYQRAVTGVEHATGELLERHRIQIAAPTR